MKVKQAYINSECNQCYEEALIYRMVKYARANACYKIDFVDKYLNALKTAKQNDIYIDFKLDLDNLKEILMERKNYIEGITSYNRPIINYYSKQIEDIILNGVTNEMDEYDKVLYLVHYATSNLTYSKKYFECCVNAPLGDGINFDFKDGIPVDKSKNSMLVLGQGLSGDVSILMCYLGNKLGLNIAKVSTTHKDNSYSFNIVTFKDGTKSYLDVFGLICGDRMFDQCLLVSNEVLNEETIFGNKNIFDSNVDLSQTKTLPRYVISGSYLKVKESIDKVNQLIDHTKSDIFDQEKGYYKIR